MSEYQFRRILKNFSLDLTATDTAKMTGFSTRSINSIFIKIRYRVAEYCESRAPRHNRFEGEIEYLGPHEINRANKPSSEFEPVVFGLYYSDGFVYTEVLPKAIKNELIQTLKPDGTFDSSIQNNGCPAYDGILDFGSKKYFNGLLSQDQLRERESRPGSEPFWRYTKQRMSKFKGLRKQMFYLHLKETEFRFNHRHDSIYSLLMTLLRNHPI